ncbi:MAG TPA: D-glycero-beta-D-manno-heptose-7-phosphate kinase [Syntrophales bacterium]|nr:D-glycero-beta-D-manno-heptose-7-phosphate kinase [Syntrophales bacterium]HOL58916.1 D-glycero-beta-D-manno-heptose-7-phosphate kinase [Syntrophales bacterium]HPO35243.1 D-glycero-beta-D-manno-heptose-7-phosphate kinase [Syntrophales bacterium]
MISNRRAIEIIDRFPFAHVLVVGDIMVDHFIWGKVARISPEAPVPVVEVQEDSVMLGGAANVMNNIRSLDGQVYGVGIVGADEMGERLLGELGRRNIDTEGIVVELGRPTTIKTRIVAHGQQVVRFDRESKKEVSRRATEKMLARIESLLPALNVIVVSDYNKGVVTRELLTGLKKLISGTQVMLCVDPKKTDFSFYQGAHVITPNHHEAERATGMEIANRRSLMKVGEELLKRFAFQAALITRGEQGMSLFEQGASTVHTEFPADAREVFDVTGAGDTAIGTFALAVASGANLREAAYLANKAAGVVVGKTGTATVTRKELKRVLKISGSTRNDR